VPVFTVPIHEYNHCHSPEDGKFCSTSGYAAGFDKMRDMLLRASFSEFPDQDNENLAVIDSAGERVGQSAYIGTIDSVEVTQEQQHAWFLHFEQTGRPLTVAHTHPSGSAFSFDDLNFANAHNAFTHAKSNRTQISIDRMVVFDRHGNWQELRFKRWIPPSVLEQIRSKHQFLLNEVQANSLEATNQELGPLLGVAPNVPALLEAKRRGRITQGNLDEYYRKHYARKTPFIWKTLAIQYADYFDYRTETKAAAGN
jgi:hypothetical protein